MSTETAFALYLRAAENFAEVSASRQLDHAMLATAKAKLSAAQKEYWRAVDAEPE